MSWSITWLGIVSIAALVFLVLLITIFFIFDKSTPVHVRREMDVFKQPMSWQMANALVLENIAHYDKPMSNWLAVSICKSILGLEQLNWVF